MLGSKAEVGEVIARSAERTEVKKEKPEPVTSINWEGKEGKNVDGIGDLGIHDRARRKRRRQAVRDLEGTDDGEVGGDLDRPRLCKPTPGGNGGRPGNQEGRLSKTTWSGSKTTTGGKCKPTTGGNGGRPGSGEGRLHKSTTGGNGKSTAGGTVEEGGSDDEATATTDPLTEDEEDFSEDENWEWLQDRFGEGARGQPFQLQVGSPEDDAVEDNWDNMEKICMGLEPPQLWSGERVSGHNKRQLRRENKRKRIERQEAQPTTTYWKRHAGKFAMPSPRHRPLFTLTIATLHKISSITSTVQYHYPLISVGDKAPTAAQYALTESTGYLNDIFFI
eukprot:scaffold5042_cov23-Cyclotella_meneghiniana.AAC.1